ncbi:MAG: ARC6/PARC6 family protein [Microcoleaceae cyanobacterium]
MMKLKFLSPLLILAFGLVTPVTAKAEVAQEVAQNAFNPPLIISQVQTRTTSLSLGEAADLINDWLTAKSQIFGPPFDQQTLATYATGTLYVDTLQAIDFLMENQGYYEYGVQKIESVDQFAIAGNKATIEVQVTEDSTFYKNGRVVDSSFNTKRVRYKLEYRGNAWKIADSQILN